MSSLYQPKSLQGDHRAMFSQPLNLPSASAVPASTIPEVPVNHTSSSCATIKTGTLQQNAPIPCRTLGDYFVSILQPRQRVYLPLASIVLPLSTQRLHRPLCDYFELA